MGIFERGRCFSISEGGAEIFRERSFCLVFWRLKGESFGGCGRESKLGKRLLAAIVERWRGQTGRSSVGFRGKDSS